MKCEFCNEREATIHLTQVLDGSVKKLHLCETCAAEHGFDVQGSMSITDVLLGLGKEEAKPTKLRSAERSCPRCHMRRADFKKTGRLGCPECYRAFKEELKPLLHVMHRHDHHTGKVPASQHERLARSKEMAKIQRELEKAIADERYEEAARLRDQMQELREAGSV